MPTCSVYGLGVRVNMPLAGLTGLAASTRVDVALNLGPLPAQLEGGLAEPWSQFYATDLLDDQGTPCARVSRHESLGHYRIEYADGTVIVIDAVGEAIWAQGAADATIEDTATYLLGPVLSFVLRLRGVTSLHASAVVVDRNAVAFVGPAGAGKSSIAAAFARRGHAVLTDDVTPLKDLGDRFEVQPAYPRVRLWPDSVESLFGSPDALPKITPTWDKRYLDLNGSEARFEREPVELGAIYILGPRGAVAQPNRVEPLERAAALMALIGETSAARLLDRNMRAREFDLLGRLVERVPVRRLSPSGDISRISRLCETVLRDFEKLHRS